MAKRGDGLSNSKFNLFKFNQSKGSSTSFFGRAAGAIKKAVSKVKDLFKPAKKSPKTPTAKPKDQTVKPAAETPKTVPAPQKVELPPDLTPPEPPEAPEFEDVSNEDFIEALKDWADLEDMGLTDDELEYVANRVEEENQEDAKGGGSPEYDPDTGEWILWSHGERIVINNIHRKPDSEMMDYMSELEDSMATYVSEYAESAKGRMNYGDMLEL